MLTGEIGGPLALGGKEGGYYLYGESENSGSYYENSSTDQSILQASIDFQLSDSWRTEFGGMYQYFKGNQVAGWNRLSQALIDDGTYITGSPDSLDADGNGYLSGPESAGATLNPFYPFDPLNSNMALTTGVGTTHLKCSQVLVQEDDTLEDDVVTLYFDLIGELAGGLKIQNKLYFESLENLNENAYGFSQYADTYVIEDQLNFEFGIESGMVKSNFQFGPSIRYQDFEHGDNFAYEYFDRRDLSLGPDGGSPIDRREWATRPRPSSTQEDWSTQTVGHFVDYGAAFLADLTFFDKLNLLAGARYDYMDMTSVAAPNTNSFDYLSVEGQRFTDKDGGFSWSASLSYDLFGVRPYATIARQSTLVLGQGGQIPTQLLASGSAIGKSKLDEFGVKTTTLGGKLFVALNYFKQEARTTVRRTRSPTTPRRPRASSRAALGGHRLLTVTSAYSNLKIYNLGPSAASQFSFMGAQDLIAEGIDPADVYGGTLAWSIATPDHRKAGIPENIYSLNLLFGSTNGPRVSPAR